MNNKRPKLLIIILLLLGMVFFGISTTYKIINNYRYKDYIKTTATFVNSNYLNNRENETQMYTLTYIYTVDGNNYYYTTDYSTSVIPRVGSTIKVKYNPINPTEVYSVSFNGMSILQIVGSFFLFGVFIMLFGHIVWLKDIVIFLFSGNLLIVFIINKFYYGAYIFVIIILGIVCFASIMEFISYVKKNKFSLSNDIKDNFFVKKIQVWRKRCKTR